MLFRSVDDMAVSGLLRWVSRSGTEAEAVREEVAIFIVRRQHNTTAIGNETRRTLLRML